MDKTVNINLAGRLFQIDNAAYLLLRDYLQAINLRFINAPGGNETIDDIEARIAEIFQSQQGLTGVISAENVRSMISILGQPEVFDQSENTYETPLHTSQKRKLYRNPYESIFGGVAGGLGAYLNIDPVWIRLLFILFTIFYGVGIFVYIALWIALPSAHSDAQKKDMYGDTYYSAANQEKQTKVVYTNDRSVRNHDHTRISAVGNAFNEVFRALGRSIFIFFRIILIIIGITFVLSGFTIILYFIMVFFLKYPWFILSNGLSNEIFYLPDFFKYLVNPSLTPWIITLTFLVVLLPALAIIYWGVKMIFWFKAREHILSLICFVVWVMSTAALAIILFNAGLSFAEIGRTSSQIVLQNAPDTLYIMTGRKLKIFNTIKRLTCRLKITISLLLIP